MFRHFGKTTAISGLYGAAVPSSFGVLLTLVAGCITTASTSPGCQLGEETRGEEGRVDFHYGSGAGCFFGCDTDRPLLTGTRESIHVDGPGDDRGVKAYSTDRSVAVFTTERSCSCEYCDDEDGTDCGGDPVDDDYQRCGEGGFLECDNRFEVEALSPGNAHLELRREDGSLVDRVEIYVREADRGYIEGMVEDEEEYREDDHFRLRRGESMTLSARLMADNGRELLATHGVGWEIDDPKVVRPRDGFELWPASDLFDIVAETRGVTVVRMYAAGIQETVTVEVTR
jgi:hypothetical protein